VVALLPIPLQVDASSFRVVLLEETDACRKAVTETLLVTLDVTVKVLQSLFSIVGPSLHEMPYFTDYGMASVEGHLVPESTTQPNELITSPFVCDLG
jgi:hypothetical protein